MTRAKRWFAARLLSEDLHPSEPNAAPLFEESIILLRARDAAEARARSEEMAARSETEYSNPDGHTVRWVFREVLEVQELVDDDIADGTEVYHALLGADELAARRRALVPFEEAAPARSG